MPRTAAGVAVADRWVCQVLRGRFRSGCVSVLRLTDLGRNSPRPCRSGLLPRRDGWSATSCGLWSSRCCRRAGGRGAHRAAACRGPAGVGGHLVRAHDRRRLGQAAGRVGLRVRGDVLAAAAGVARGGGVVPAASGGARPARAAGAARLVSHRLGQRERPGEKGGRADRPEPHRPREIRLEVPLAGRRRWAADRGRGHRREHARLDARRADPGRAAGGEGTRPGRPRRRPVKLHADKGYDNRRVRRYLARRDITARIARRGVESSCRLGRHRWVVERTVAWLLGFRRLALRYDRSGKTVTALVTIACALICYRRLS
jgi:transposase